MIITVNMLPSFGKISMGITAKYIEEEFSISATSMGWILGAFAIGYALFQVPGGWAGDRYGPRKVLRLTTSKFGPKPAPTAQEPDPDPVKIPGTFHLLIYGR